VERSGIRSLLGGDGGASYEDLPRLGGGVLTASDQVSVLEADSPCARGGGVIGQRKKMKRS
jgi:hypothetical protein